MRGTNIAIDQQCHVRASLGKPNFRYGDRDLDEDGNGAAKVTGLVTHVTFTFTDTDGKSVDCTLNAMTSPDTGKAMVYYEITESNPVTGIEGLISPMLDHLATRGTPTPKFQKQKQSDITSDKTEDVPA